MVTLARRFMPDGRVLFDIVQLVMAIVVFSGIAALRRAPQKINAGWQHLAGELPRHDERDYRRGP